MSRAISRYMITNATALPSANTVVGQMAMRHAAETPDDLGFLENIPHAADGMDQRPLAFAVYFITQTVDLHIHDVGSGIDAHAPHAIQDHRTSHDPPGITHQVFQKREFLGG